MNDEKSRAHRWGEATPATCVRCGAEKYKTGTYCPGYPRAKPTLGPQAAALLFAALAMGRAGR